MNIIAGYDLWTTDNKRGWTLNRQEVIIYNSISWISSCPFIQIDRANNGRNYYFHVETVSVFKVLDPSWWDEFTVRSRIHSSGFQFNYLDWMNLGIIFHQYVRRCVWSLVDSFWGAILWCNWAQSLRLFVRCFI